MAKVVLVKGNNNISKQTSVKLHNSSDKYKRISAMRLFCIRSSYKERKGNALALGADEGRGKLR